jgi:hypothetical protein
VDYETIFHDNERPFESIFYILGIKKIDFDEEARSMFYVR